MHARIYSRTWEVRNSMYALEDALARYRDIYSELKTVEWPKFKERWGFPEDVILYPGVGLGNDKDWLVFPPHAKVDPDRSLAKPTSWVDEWLAKRLETLDICLEKQRETIAIFEQDIADTYLVLDPSLRTYPNEHHWLEWSPELGYLDFVMDV